MKTLSSPQLRIFCSYWITLGDFECRSQGVRKRHCVAANPRRRHPVAQQASHRSGKGKNHARRNKKRILNACLKGSRARKNRILRRFQENPTKRCFSMPEFVIQSLKKCGSSKDFKLCEGFNLASKFAEHFAFSSCP